MKREKIDLKAYIWPIPGKYGLLYPQFAARVSGNHARSARNIRVTNALGRWPVAGEIAYIGPSIGDASLGIVRIISSSPTQGILTICENELQVPDGAYVYCPFLFAPVSRFQRIVEEGGNPVIYKDYDIPFDPSRYLPPKALLTSPVEAAAGEWLNVSGSGVPYQQGTSITQVTIDPADGEYDPSRGVRFATPGFRWISCTVRDSAGQEGKVYRPVFVGMEPVRIALSEIRGEVGAGWTVRCTIPYLEDDPLPLSLLVILGLAYPVICWITETEVRYERGVRYGEITGRSALSLLGQMRNFGIQVEDVSPPTSWFHIGGLTVRRAVQHLLEWHTTFNLVENWSFDPSYPDRPIKIQRFHDGTVLDALNRLLDDASACFAEQEDATGSIFRPPTLESDRAGIPTISLFSGPVRVDEGEKVGQLRGGGFAYEAPLLSYHPGDTPYWWARREDKQGLIVADQNELNRLVGMRFTERQSPSFYATLAQRGDDVPMARQWVALQSTDIRGWVRTKSMAIRIGTVVTEVAGKVMNPVAVGETITIPPVPPPSPPEWPIPPAPVPPPYYSGVGLVLLRWKDGVFRSANFYDFTAPAEWERVFTTLPGDETHDFRYIERAGTIALALLTKYRLYLCPDIRASVPQWTLVFDAQRAGQVTGDPVQNFDTDPYSLVTLVQDGNYIGFFANVYRPDLTNKLYYFYSTDFGTTWRATFIGSRTVYSYHVYCVLNTAGTNEIIAYYNTGIFGADTKMIRSVNAGATWSAPVDTRVDGSGILMFTSKAVKPWQWGVNGTTIYATIAGYRRTSPCAKSTDRGVNYTTVLSGTSVGRGIEVWTYDPLRVGVLSRVATGSGDAIRFSISTDGGSNWTHRMTPMFVPDDVTAMWNLHGNPLNRHEWCIAMHRSGDTLFYGRVFIAITLNDGVTWYDRTGNLSVLEPYYRGRDYLITPPFRPEG